MKKTIFALICFSLSGLVSVSHAGSGGVYLGATRIVYDSEAKATTFTANNSSTEDTWLIRSWVSPYQPSSNNDEVVDDFIITPPLHRLDPKASVQLRINRAMSELPADREQVYYLNVLAIPPKSQQTSGSVVQFALNTQIKLFYRPHGLNNEKQVIGAYQQLTVAKQGQRLVVKNPSAYYLTLTGMEVNGTPITFSDPMISPFGEVSADITDKQGNFTYQVINDFGGKSAMFTVAF